MFKPCECKTNKGNNCRSNGAFTRQHDDHIHNVCDTHKKKEEVVFIESTCTTARKVSNPENLATVQGELPITNTDQLEKLAKLREKIDTERSVNKEEKPMVRIMVTGHTKLSDEKHIESVLSWILEGYINTYGKQNIIAVSGGALGVDRLFARAAYKLDVPYEIYVPMGYENVFIGMNNYNMKSAEERAKDMTNFYKMLELASAVYDENGNLLTDRDPHARYTRGANFVRNTTMVRVSQHHIAVANLDPREVIRRGTNGGTYHCIREMKRLGVKEILWVPAQATLRQVHTVHINKES